MRIFEWKHMGGTSLLQHTALHRGVLRDGQQLVHSYVFEIYSADNLLLILFSHTVAQFDGHSYAIISNASSYTTAQQSAASMTYNNVGGYLATIDSAAEYQFLSWVMRARNAYVSGSDAASEGNWVLTDGPNAGQPAPYLPWSFGEPSGVGQNCLALSSVDGVMDVSCSTGNMDFVVEFDRKHTSNITCN